MTTYVLPITENKSPHLWLIGGTSDSAAIAKSIAPLGLPCTITVTTPSAVKLYPQINHFTVKIGLLNQDNLAEFILQEKITAIVDASHPYAVQISQLAMAAATTYNLPYLRYERPLIEDLPISDHIIKLDSWESLIKSNYLDGQRVLLTIGYRYLPQFKACLDQAMFFVRILPSQVALETALNVGFTGDRIVAIRPPISYQLEKALWENWQITTVVTKASGTAGGQDLKIKIANELGTKLIMIERPVIDYPKMTRNLTNIIQFCHLLC